MRQRTYFNHSLVNDFRSHVKINGKDVYDPVKGHTGVDINCVYGTEISMPVDLIFLQQTMQDEMGMCAYYKDSEENVLVFAHLSEVISKKDSVCVAGETLVKTGNSGRVSSNPHLHLEIIAQKPEVGHEVMTRSLMGYGKYNIDPVAYLDKVFANPTLDDLAWHLKHFPSIDPKWFQEKADLDPEYLKFNRAFAVQTREWFGSKK